MSRKRAGGLVAIICTNSRHHGTRAWEQQQSFRVVTLRMVRLEGATQPKFISAGQVPPGVRVEKVAMPDGSALRMAQTDDQSQRMAMRPDDRQRFTHRGTWQFGGQQEWWGEYVVECACGRRVLLDERELLVMIRTWHETFGRDTLARADIMRMDSYDESQVGLPAGGPVDSGL